MRKYLTELNRRNGILFWFGSLNILISFFCLGLMSFDYTQILGVNAWVKPFKFYLSAGIFTWSISWMIYHINSKRSRIICGWLIGISTFTENCIVFYQSAKGVPSHYNNSTPFNSMLYSMMGICMSVFLLTVIYITIVFFRQRKMPISQHYSWGIRMGFLIFSIFSSIGIIMMIMKSHTIGGADGGPGLKFLNWSTKFGDLRIAHIMSVFSLQIIPLVSYYFFEKKRQVINFSITYSIVIIALLILAFMGITLMTIK